MPVLCALAGHLHGVDDDQLQPVQIPRLTRLGKDQPERPLKALQDAHCNAAGDHVRTCPIRWSVIAY